MPLNLSTGDGDFTPYLKYNAKAGRFYIRPQGAAEDVEIDRPRLIFDMANIKTGWLYYAEGAGPEKVWDPSNATMAPRPAGPRKFKRGFEVLVVGNDQIPGVGTLGLREFSSTAGNVITAILQMYDQYEREAPNNPGCLPFFACSGVKPVQGAYGTNYEPRFELKGWVARAKIPALDEHQAEQAEIPEHTGTNGNGATERRSAPQLRDDDHQYASRPSRQRADDMDDEIPF